MEATPLLGLLTTREGTLHILAAIYEGLHAAIADVQARSAAQPVNGALIKVTKMCPWKLENHKINSIVNRLGVLPRDPGTPLPPDAIPLDLPAEDGTVEHWRTMNTEEFLDRVMKPLARQSTVVQSKVLEEMGSIGSITAQLAEAVVAIRSVLDSGDHLASLYLVLFCIACKLIPAEELGPPALYNLAIAQWETETNSLVNNLQTALGCTGNTFDLIATPIGVTIKWCSNITHGYRQWHLMTRT